jgi:hypothetical protein
MGGDFAGPYSWTYHPWVKEMHDSWATYNYAMKGAQLGVTEVAINRSFYTLDIKKRDVLYVLPTAKGAAKFSKGRFTPALALSPYLKGLFTDLNSIDMKQAGQNCLYISGSRGDNNLKNIPASELILDEIDEMEQKQIWLALERLSGQLEKHVWGISTPTIPEFGIHKLYLGSTQEHFFFKCPHCGRQTELVWPECVEIVGEYDTDVRCNESFLKCKECKHKLEHKDKPKFLAEGKWQQTVSGNQDVRGFYINQLYSYTVTPGELVVAYFRGFGDEYAAKEFHNSKLGMPFVGAGARLTDEMVGNAHACEPYSLHDPRPVYAGDRVITMGIDQGPMGYIVVCEWFFSRPPDKDRSAAARCKVVWIEKYLDDNWDRLDELMHEWQVLYAVIDGQPETNAARQFARRFVDYVGLCRYDRGHVAKEIVTSEEHTGAPLHKVDRTGWLSTVLGRFKTNPTRIHLPIDIPDEFKKHVKSLVRTYDKDENGNPYSVYKSIGADHFAHALTYAEIALQFVPLSGGQNLSKIW